MDSTSYLHYQQDMAFQESELADALKAISKIEQETKAKEEAKEKAELEAYEAALQAEKTNLESVRAKRLKSLQK